MEGLKGGMPEQKKDAIKRESKRLFIGVIAGVVLFFALLAAVFLFRPASGEDGEEVYGNTSGNLANMGFVAESGGWIYYNAGFDGLFKARLDGSEKTKLANGLCLYINVVDDCVYYNDWSSDNLCKIRIDGTGFTKLLDYADHINVQNGWIYYKYGYIYKIRTDGTEETQISDNKAQVMTVANGWIYYVNRDDGYSLYKIRIDGTYETKLRSVPPQHINVEGDWIYYEDFSNKNFKLYKMRIDGTSEIILSDEVDSHFNVSNGWIYYRNINDSCLHKMRTDGTGDTKLTEIDDCNYNIAGDWIYYYNNGLYRMKTDGTENQRVE